MVEGLQRVVVTGLGAVTPIGNNIADYWSGLTSGRNGVALISLFDASQHVVDFHIIFFVTGNIIGGVDQIGRLNRFVAKS